MTKGQLKPYWRAVRRAAFALGLDGAEAVETYRRAVLFEEVGAEHAADVDPGDGYDRVMLRLAIDGGDWGAAERFGSGAERRMARLVETVARQVVELKAIEGEWGGEGAVTRDQAVGYVVGCLRQAMMPVAAKGGDWWLDVTGSMAFQVFKMLDTHRRRLLRRVGYRGPLTFDAGASYEADGAVVTVRPVYESEEPPIHVGKVPA